MIFNPLSFRLTIPIMDAFSPDGGGPGTNPGAAVKLDVLVPDSDSESITDSPVPTLTIGQVLDAIPKLKQVTTPNINNRLALPFKKRFVSSREEFLGVWSEKKDFVARVGGKGSSYQVNKAQRRSEDFPWPPSPQGKPHTDQESKVVLTSYGRGIGHSKYEGYETEAYKKAAPTEEHFVEKLDEFRAKLKLANEEIVSLRQDVAEKNSKLGEYLARISQLERENASLRQLDGGCDEQEEDDQETCEDRCRTGPPKKSWLQLGPRQKKRRSQMLFDALKKTSEESGVQPVQVVGSLLHR